MSGQLIPSPPGVSPAFAQQGQLDWVQFFRSTVSLPVEILGRLARAHVEPITYLATQWVCAGLKLQPNGQKNIRDSLSKLKAFSSYGDVIWFGFGIRHILKDLSFSEPGLACIGLCGALSTNYDLSMSAEVLRELCLIQGADRSQLPSIAQFRDLVNCCAGAITHSDFKLKLNSFVRLVEPPGEMSIRVEPGPTDAQSLAKALQGLINICNGREVSITFMGGIDCTWLATLAEWLLSFSIEIQTKSGIVIYQTNSKQSSSPQVRFYYVIEGAYSVQLIGKCFRLPSIPNIIKPISNHEYLGFTRHSSWSTILRDAFGESAVLDLVSGPRGRGLARMFCIAASGNYIAPLTGPSSPIPLFYVPWPDFTPSHPEVRGNDFFEFVRERLPELRGCVKEHPFDKLDPDPSISYAELAGGLECCREEPSNTSSFSVAHWSTPELCPISMAKAILRFVWLLSSIKASSDILPTPMGLKYLYQGVETENTGGSDSKHNFVHRDQISGRFVSHFDDVMSIFAGPSRIEEAFSSRTVACSRAGICAYSVLLSNIDISPPDSCYIYMVPGYIETIDGRFDTVVDWSDRNETQETFTQREAYHERGRACQPRVVNFELLARTKFLATGILEVKYRGETGTSSSSPAIRISNLRHRLCVYLESPGCDHRSTEFSEHLRIQQNPEDVLLSCEADCWAQSHVKDSVEQMFFHPSKWSQISWDTSPIVGSRQYINIVQMPVWMLYFRFCLPRTRHHMAKLPDCLFCIRRLARSVLKTYGIGNAPLCIHSMYGSVPVSYWMREFGIRSENGAG